MNVFLTGATGFIGGSVAARLLGAGHDIRGLTRDPEKAGAVINAADSDHRAAVEHLIAGLAGSGKPFLQTSGSSIVGDNAGGEVSERVFTEDEVTGGTWTRGWRGLWRCRTFLEPGGIT